MDNVLTIAKNIMFVKGYYKNLLIDLQNDCWYHIDFSLNDDNDIKNLSLEVTNYMKEENMIFEFPKRHLSKLLPLSLEYDSSADIENAILDRNALSNYSIEKTIDFFNLLGVKHIQIRWFDTFDESDLQIILDNTIESSVESIDIITPFSLSYKSVLELKKKY